MMGHDVRDGWGWALSLGGGSALWAATAVLGGRAEPWDSEAYWTAAYPLALLLAALAGALVPRRTWRWGLAVVFAQLPVMFAGGSGLGLLPLGLIMLGVLAVPAMVTARIGAWLRAWLTA